MGRFKDEISKVSQDVIGAAFWVKKTVTSSAITTAPVAITTVATGGELAIEDVILKTDQTTGIAGGTTFRVVSDNSKGTTSVFLTTVARLGASKERNFDTEFSIAALESSSLGINKPTVLEIGKKLSVSNTDSVGTGAGTVDIYIKFRKLSSSSKIQPA